MATFDDFAAFHERPSHMEIVLSPRQIYAIGRVIVQWSALHEILEHQLIMWAHDPIIPPEHRQKPEDIWETTRRLRFLRVASEHILAAQPALKREFQFNLAKITLCKGKRDWFAHGTYALQDNNNPARIVVIYKGHKFRIATAKAEALADEIGLLTGWLMNFGWRAKADIFRALLEKLPQSSTSHDSHPSGSNASKPLDPPRSSRE